MSGYNSQRAVREIITITLRSEGKDPTRYNIAGIARDAFYSRGPGYGYGAASEDIWRKALSTHRRKL